MSYERPKQPARGRSRAGLPLRRLLLVGLASVLGIGLSLLLMGCSPSLVATPPPAPTPAQTLPITAEADIKGQTIQLEVATTPEQQAMGLMFRTTLAPDRGMLFAFDSPRPLQFWMRNTLIPLDMVFMLDGEVKAIVANAPPCRTVSCPTYGPRSTRVNQVIELAGGRAAELGLAVGDRVTLRFLEATPQP